MNNITNKLKTFRLALGLNYEELAESVGVSTSLVQKIEIGNRNPSYKFLTKFINAYPKSDIKEIFFNTPNHKM